MPRRRVLIIGGSLAGVSAAERIRARGDDAEIVIVGDEGTAPYDRPPLSKQVLTGGADIQLLHELDWYAENSIELRLGTRAVALDRWSNVVTLADGTTLDGDAVLIATGTRARRVAAWDCSPHVHYLRTAEDAQLLARVLAEPASLTVVGSGFIGLEVAAAAVRAGWRVTVIEAAATPLQRVLPAELAARCVAAFADAGVRILTGVYVTGIVDGSEQSRVELSTGDKVETNAMVVGIGAIPNVEWLAGSGVAIREGIICGPDGTTNRKGIFAAGDVSAWPNALTGQTHRVEQWQAARDQGQRAADAILGDAAVWDVPPYFWSDLLGGKLQFSGHFDHGMDLHVVQRGNKLLAVMGDEQLRGIATLGSPRWQGLGQRNLLARMPMQQARSWANECAA